jgi:hypothetical protein
MKKIWYFGLILILTLSICIAFSLYAQEKKAGEDVYTVKKGDTLWDISSKFLNNPFLWPKLWQRNPYITNPHWIYPGNPVRLSAFEEVKETKKEEPKTVAVQEQPKAATKEPAQESEVMKAEPPPEIKKPEVLMEKKPPEEKKAAEEKPVFREVRFAGFFSDINLRGIGYVLDSREGKNIMAAGDICYVGFRVKDPVPIGQKFTTITSMTDRIAIDNEIVQYGKRYNVTGIIQIIDQYGEFYTAKVIESFQEISKGDFIIPYNKEKMEVGKANK